MDGDTLGCIYEDTQPGSESKGCSKTQPEGVHSNVGLLKQNLIKAIPLLPCVKCSPCSTAAYDFLHTPLQVNNGPALNIEANLTQNYIRLTKVD